MYIIIIQFYSLHFSCTLYVYLLCTTPLQIADVDLMELIRTNVKLTIPYAGAFLKKDDRYITCIYD